MTLQEILFYAAVVFFALAAICIAVAVAIFFMRDIPGIRNYLTGKTLREAAERGTSGSGRNRRKAPTSANAKTGSAVPGSSGSLESQSGPIRHVNTVTPEHSRQRAAAEARAQNNGSKKSAKSSAKAKASKRSHASETPAVASSGISATTVLDDGSNATTILGDDTAATTILETTAENPDVQDEAAHPVETATAEPDATEEKKVHEGFEVVKKIVLTASAGIVSAD